ncbi:DUF6270 domain-containing protein [Arthrobacter sp. AK01]|uniref:DUF6270 domain-containing protein n=1 Tax=Arthrobacter sp. AK01 TaxID=2894084 RepID=UPI001E4914F7|nr:DUF6270 domain-containing protein [Arthrobacter sp. AK01]MCD4852205.1 DUF6270 domain-containing protein [Arthrobacter sp. AK01]
MARIYVYGSCVSRDSVEFLDMSLHRLLGYTARQSLISAVGDVYPASAQQGTLESRFQIRNLQGDFDGSIFRTLLDVADQADYIFWDLTDERLGVIKVAENTYVTRSVELIQSGLIENLEKAAWIQFGTEEHYELWQESVRQFAEFTRAHGLQSKLVLFNLPWSMWDDEGTPLKKIWDLFPDEANNVLARYVAVVRQHMDVNYLDIPWAQVAASKTHKWGVAPYHYEDHVYEVVADKFKILETAKSSGREGQGGVVSTSDLAWRDAVADPPTFSIPPDTSAFGLQFDARSAGSAVRLILSLELEGADGLHLYKHRITKSVMADIGHFRYLNLDGGQRTYFAGFDLPEGVSCKSLTVKGWQIGKGNVELGNMSLFTNAKKGAR